MSRPNSGGPAFPLTRVDMNWGGGHDDHGMSLRDYFAARAPALTWWGYLCGRFRDWDQSRSDRTWREIDCQHRFEWADQMIALRERKFT